MLSGQFPVSSSQFPARAFSSGNWQLVTGNFMIEAFCP
jgi:hypothetical protein